MFGTRGHKELLELERLIDRVRPLSPFKHAAENLSSSQRRNKPTLQTAAVCLDTCVLIHMAKHSKAEAILDYFSTLHKGLLVVSAQTLQEFWNNHIFAIDTVASGIERKFGELGKEIAKVDPSWANFSEEIGDLLSRLKGEYGHLHEPKLRARLADFYDQLSSRAVLSEVPRSRFFAYAQQRKTLKTPPGFEDSGNGDFFIWLDFLYAIRTRASRVSPGALAIMVTDDRKKDWSKGAVPHPTLAAEMESYTGLQFETWTLEKLWKSIEAELEPD